MTSPHRTGALPRPAAPGRFVCIHGHFYQPPRESPWLEEIELQPSASPYHDWNERIDAECYRPNAAARVLDARGRVADIVNNYSHVSFDMGPTLMSWLESHDPETYGAVLRADAESRELQGGHGSAMAQAYNHAILPLMNARDRQTQVLWGARDFEHRFGRKPEGMWLPETAVDVPTLEALADAGIAFTVLAPHQARRVRPFGATQWDHGAVDITRPYRAALPSGRSLALFLYDGAISQAVAFEHLLSDGGRFAGRIRGAFRDASGGAQLVSVATDGETFGHHHAFGDMALAWTIRHFGSGAEVSLTNFGRFLALHPPTHELEVVAPSAWSCAHGVERWRSDCGCQAGSREGWRQGWRGPLRRALDNLRDAIAPAFEKAAAPLLADPWDARDHYVDVILDRSPASIERWVASHARRSLSPAEILLVRGLMEMQRHLLLMYTSCGWFFADLSGIETVQVIAYAARAAELADRHLGRGHERRLLRDLAKAKSNLAEQGDGRRIYDEVVRPGAADARRIGMRAALQLFTGTPLPARVACYDVEGREAVREELGSSIVAAARLRLTSRTTGEATDLGVALVSPGGLQLSGGAWLEPPGGAEVGLEPILGAFRRGEVTAAQEAATARASLVVASLASLAQEERGTIWSALSAPIERGALALARELVARHGADLALAASLELAPAEILGAAAHAVVDAELREAIAQDDWRLLDDVRTRAARLGVRIDDRRLGETLASRLALVAEEVAATPEDAAALERLTTAAAIVQRITTRPDLARAQNAVFRSIRPLLASRRAHAKHDTATMRWIAAADAVLEVIAIAPPVTPESR